MRGQCYDTCPYRLQYKTVRGNLCFRLPGCQPVEPPGNPDENGGEKAQNHVLKQQALQWRGLQLPSPGEDACPQDRHRHERGHNEIVVSHHCECGLSQETGNKIKHHCNQKQRDGKMDQHHMLGMFCEQGRFQIERIHSVAGY